MARAEELKAQVEPAATPTATDSTAAKAHFSVPPPKPERRRPPNQATTAGGATASDGSSSSDEGEGLCSKKNVPEAIIASVIPISEDDGGGLAVLELPPLPYDARPASPAPAESGGAGACPSCGGAGAMTEAATTVEAREAWLQEWEAALVVRDAELRRRELALEAAAADQGSDEAGPKDTPTEEGEQEEQGVRGGKGELAIEAAAAIGSMELKEE
jgi:hypothetical protein